MKEIDNICLSETGFFHLIWLTPVCPFFYSSCFNNNNNNNVTGGCKGKCRDGNVLRSWSFEDGTKRESLMNSLIWPYPAFQGALQNKEEPACMECFRNTVVWSGVKGIACSQKDGVVWSPSWNLGSGYSLLWHIPAIFSTEVLSCRYEFPKGFLSYP